MGSRLDPALSLNLVPYSYGRLALLEFIKLKASTYRRWTVIHMDIANFRLINQLLGYEQGDLILKEITNLLSASARYTWFNMGSGIWVGISEYRDVNFVTQQIKEGRLKTRDHIKQRLNLNLRLESVFGVASGSSLQDVVDRAESACCDAKNRGQDLMVFDSVRSDWQVTGLVGELLLGNPLDNVIQLYRQRIQYLDGHHHFEVLSRVKGQSVGAAMIMIEQLRLSKDFDLMLLKRVIETVGPNDPLHTVNFSNQSITDSGTLLEAISIIKGRTNIAIEVTETAQIIDFKKVGLAIDMLVAAGIPVYLDDFGEGASALSLLEMPWSALKLSKTICHEHASPDILEAVIALAQNRKMTVIAECVESQAHMDRLTRYGVDAFQGYHIHRPEPFGSSQPIKS